ncbi:hypothetical protein [Henriciella sp.]|uniref:hypothetical protein n=1 Tax=Henriciella sp. TaxID=1968823 RepID=UPI00261BFAE9|nr:hypothetical protein [Henriciella sp.]
MSNVEKLPVQPREDTRAVTLIGTNLPAQYLDEAEPSPLMHTASLWWHRAVRTMQVLAILLLLGIYPALVITSHEINDDPIVLSAKTPWASPETGVAMTLIGREVEGPGWASDRSAWHPQARLTGLPAWQASIAESLSQYSGLMAVNAQTSGGNADPDLSAAARLLSPDPGLEQIPRLMAAAEALARYEGRLERNLAANTSTLENVIAELNLFAAWADASYERLGERIGTRDGWPASDGDIEAFFEARARAQVASQLLGASLAAAPEIAVQPSVMDQLDRIEASWRRAATLDPLLVSSQSGNARLMADHLAMMAYHLRQASDATKALATSLHAEQGNTTEGASSEIAEGAFAGESES